MVRSERLVLVASSDEFTRAVLRESIVAAGDATVAVVTADSHAEAMRHVSEHSLDVAIVAHELPPGATGLQVLRQIGERQPNCLRVLIPGELSLEAAVAAVNSGDVSRLIPSPVKAEAVKQAVFGLATGGTADTQSEPTLLDLLPLTELKKAFAELMHAGALRLVLQPVACVACRAVVAHEALLRSSHAVLRGPAEVFEAAVALGTLHDVGQVLSWLARQHLADLPSQTALFMNLHPRELKSPEQLLQRLVPLLPLSDRMVFELTDCAEIPSLKRWKETAQLLAQGGFKLGIDDLSTAYGSMSLLAHVRPHFVKSAMSVVRGIEASVRQQRLLRQLVDFGAATGTLIVAKGVETETEASAVRACGVPLIQGFLTGEGVDEISADKICDEPLDFHVGRCGGA